MRESGVARTQTNVFDCERNAPAAGKVLLPVSVETGRVVTHQANYERIAATFDDNRERHEIPPEPCVRELFDAGRERVRLLDVGCGTGNFLRAQSTYWGERLACTGIEPSQAMLERAKAKCPDIALVRGRAETLPFERGAFDVVVTNFAFHHFADKNAALDEMFRVLAPGGPVRIWNICPERMQGWWVYQWFPEAIEIDRERFWSIERIRAQVENRGATFAASVEVRSASARLSDLALEARRRDVSELALIDDATYHDRLRALEKAAQAGSQPEGMTETALVRITARLPAR